MIRLLIKVYKIDKSIEKELMKFGNVELVSKFFNLYAIETMPENRIEIEKIPDVISVREERGCRLMPVM